MLLHNELRRLVDCLVVQSDVIFEVVRDSGFFEDSLPGAFRLARPAIDALVGIYEKLVRENFFVCTRIAVDAIDWAYRHAGSIDAIATESRDYPWHGFSFLPIWLSRSAAARGWSRPDVP